MSLRHERTYEREDKSRCYETWASFIELRRKNPPLEVRNYFI